MVVVTPGHRYVRANFENPNEGQTIQFIEKVQENGVLTTVNDGTTNEEMLEVLKDRITHLNNILPCSENELVLFHLGEAKRWLESRTYDRQLRNVEGTSQQ